MQAQIIPFPHHRSTHTECLHCDAAPITTTGPPYCALHVALHDSTPGNGQRDPHLEKAAEKATSLVYDIRLKRLKDALQKVASK